MKVYLVGGRRTSGEYVIVLPISPATWKQGCEAIYLGGITDMRDYASVQQLLVLANMEALNAEFIQMGLSQGERLTRLNAVAIRQMRSLTGSPALMRLATLSGKDGTAE